MNQRVNWDDAIEKVKRAGWFDVSSDDFDVLEIRSANEHFSYFFDIRRATLVKRFLLNETNQVALLCEVKLVAKDGRYSPRIRLLKVDKTKAYSETVDAAESEVLMVKASVDTNGGHEQFMKLMSFVLSVKEIDSGAEAFQLARTSDVEVVRLLREKDREDLIPLISIMLDASLSEAEINVISDRKSKIAYFEKLLADDEFFAGEQERTGKTPEALWQQFFESATWIFGYGLSLVSHDVLGAKLEQVTTGANLWSGAGKRVDAVMRSRAIISTLLFCEIKRHDTPLLKANAYRPPDVYVASDEVVGGVAQLQKTVRKTYRSFMNQVAKLTDPDGSPTGLDFSTSRARQVLLVGNLGEFRTSGGINPEKIESFELFRKSNTDVEIITFDELLARAKFILDG